MTKAGIAIARTALLLAVVFATTTGHAADFYKGKKLSILVNYAPGGSTDIEARFLARHLGKFIEGNPQIVTLNRPGAGGITAVNWLGEIAPRDGLTLGYFTGVVPRAALDDPAFRLNIADLKFVSAGPLGTMLTYVRTDISSPSLKTPQEIMQGSQFWAAGISPETNKDIRMRMQLDLLGLSYSFVSGYAGAADIRLALQRSEVHLVTEPIPTYRQVIEPALTKRGEVIPLWSDPVDDGTSLSASPDSLQIGVLPYDEFYKTVKGSYPSGRMWDAFRFQNQVGSTFLRVLLMAPNTPDEAVDTIRQALTRLQNDPQARKEAEETLMFTPDYPMGDAVQQQYFRMLKAPAELKAFVLDYIKQTKTHRR